VVQASIQYRDAFGHWPSSNLLAEILQLRDDVMELHEQKAAGKCTEEDLDRWSKDGTFDRRYAESVIKAGVLQLIASQFVGQPSQTAAAKSELSDGINKAISAREKSNAHWNSKYAQAKSPRKKRKAAMPEKSGNRQ